CSLGVRALHALPDGIRPSLVAAVQQQVRSLRRALTWWAGFAAMGIVADVLSLVGLALSAVLFFCSLIVHELAPLGFYAWLAMALAHAFTAMPPAGDGLTIWTALKDVQCERAGNPR
ncbi:MAG TPA: hypothetical protein VJQ61_09450, partial [Sinomonas sp.]|nr:hypothetical protein [Sinomonas sp.]